MLLDAESGRRTVLKLPRNDKPLLWYFQQGSASYLEYISGPKDFYELIHGLTGANAKVMGQAWRINGFNHSNKYRLRIGGFFKHTWGDYGADTNGQICTAEGAGFGVTDD